MRLFGVDPLRAPRADRLRMQRRFGTLFQNGALFSALSVFENVALPLRELKYLDESIIRDLVMLKLHLVEIEPQHATKMPAELSGGMAKRIALARAMALDPELLVSGRADRRPRSGPLARLRRADQDALARARVDRIHDHPRTRHAELRSRPVWRCWPKGGSPSMVLWTL